MARYLIDTSTLIDVSKRIEPIGFRLQRLVASGEVLGICPVQLAEFFTGIDPAESENWREWASSFNYWPISQNAAVLAGKYRFEYARRGIAIAIPDALTAAVAYENYATVITDNAKHFPMPEVATLSLRERRSL